MLCSSLHCQMDQLLALISLSHLPTHRRPGVRPIGIGETARRIMGKAIAAAISNDIQDAASPHLSGCEAAAHAMRKVYEAPDTDALNRSGISTNSVLLSPRSSPTPIEKMFNCSLTEKSFSPRRHHPRRPTCHGDVCSCHHTTHPSPRRQSKQASLVC